MLNFLIIDFGQSFSHIRLPSNTPFTLSRLNNPQENSKALGGFYFYEEV